MLDKGNTSRDKMLAALTEENSPFLGEGKNILIEEFGTDHVTYFSILTCIASGMKTRSEIENELGNNNIGSYLVKLEDYYKVISKSLPIFAKENSKKVRYQLNDCFLMFWFRFIESNRSVIEMGKYDILKEIIQSGYPQFSGIMLERYFRMRYSEHPHVTEVGNWWDKNSENEIDVIAIEKLHKRVTIAEVKRNPEKINLQTLTDKFAVLRPHFRGYDIQFVPLSLNDM